MDGLIRKRWAELGWETSYLGFPTVELSFWKDEANGDTGVVTRFQRGAISWNDTRKELIEIPDQLVLKSGPINIESIEGWAELTSTSAGFYTYKGHLHNSGFIGLNCKIAAGVRVDGMDSVIVAPIKELNVGGTTSFDNRDEDWDDHGTCLECRVDWEKFLASQKALVTKIDVGPAVADVFLTAFLAALAMGAAIFLSPDTDPPDTRCTQSATQHTVTDGNNRTVIEPDWVSCGTWI